MLLDRAGAGLDINGTDALRRAVVAAVAPRHAPVIIDSVFPAIEEFAAATGFVVEALVDQACGVTAS